MRAAPAPDAAAAAWLPLAGAVVGALSGALGLLAARVSHPLAAATAFAFSLALTGAIHVDGFADSCDALLANVPLARRLEIFKDPRHGTFALAGFVAVSAVSLAALVTIPPSSYPATLAIAAVAARWGGVVHMRWTRYARPNAPSSAFLERPPLMPLFIGLLVLASLVAWAAPSRVAAGAEALGAIVTATVSIVWARGRLGGAVVGDVFGFAIVLAEAAGLVIAAAMLS